MSPQDNIQIVIEYLWNHALDHAADDLILHDYSMPEPLSGCRAVERFRDAVYRVAFSDAKLEPRHVTADEKRVVFEVTFHGVNTGSLRGRPPSGKRVELPLCGVCDLEEGVIRNIRLYYDSGLLKQQLGWIPV